MPLAESNLPKHLLTKHELHPVSEHRRQHASPNDHWHHPMQPRHHSFRQHSMRIRRSSRRTTQICQLGHPGSEGGCGLIAAAIIANDCGFIAVSGAEDKCDVSGGFGGWTKGNWINCFSGTSDPWQVNTPGGRFSHCYRKNSNCSKGPLQYIFAK